MITPSVIEDNFASLDVIPEEGHATQLRKGGRGGGGRGGGGKGGKGGKGEKGGKGGRGGGGSNVSSKTLDNRMNYGVSILSLFVIIISKAICR